MTRRTDNYTAMRDRMAARFLDFDQDRMVRQFALAADADFLYLRFAARDHRIARCTGAVTWSADGFRTEAPADYNAAMTPERPSQRRGFDRRGDRPGGAPQGRPGGFQNRGDRPQSQERRAEPQFSRSYTPAPSRDQSFEDKLKQFMSESDSKLSSVRQYSDHKTKTRRR